MVRRKFGLALLVAVAAAAQSPQPSPDVLDLSVQELMQLKVTSVARKPQTLARAAAAVYVITREEIRRSGYRTVPELLRLAPGMHVGQVGAHTWAVSARGFNGVFANKMLVLIDGRSVYTPQYAGVYWELHDLMLEDIERIEVIRGPGATMWGANAVNGVINIITQSAKSTQGGLLSAHGGTSERAGGALRYGGKIGSNAWYRAFGKYAKHNESITSQGLGGGDAWRDGRGGMRLDWEPTSRDEVTALADVSRSRFDEVGELPTAGPPFIENRAYRFDASTQDVLLRWRHTHRNGSETQLQFYYDDYNRPHPVFGEHRNTADFEFQNQLRVARRHELTWGGGYRFSGDQTGAAHIAVNPASFGSNLFSTFIQDEIQLSEDKVLLTVGAKLQHNDYTGSEMQPTVRLLVEPARKHVFWSSVSRAVRTPSRLDRDSLTWIATLAGRPETRGLPQRLILAGSPENDSQPLIAWEAGYRSQPLRRLGIDIAAYRNDYKKLRSIRYGDPALTLGLQPYLTIPLTFSSALQGTTWGSEATAHFELHPKWKLVGVYNWMQGSLSIRPGAPPSTSGESSNYPEHTGSIRSQLDLPGRLQFDVGWYAVGALKDPDNLTGPISYGRTGAWSRLDLQLACPIGKHLELTGRLHSALDPHHQEFRPEAFLRPAEPRRGADLKLEWRF